MSGDKADLGIEQFKQGIFAFVMEWVMYNNKVAGVEVGSSHIEPVQWLQQLCDSLEEQTQQGK